MIHTMFNILYVLSCLKNTLVVTLLEFSTRIIFAGCWNNLLFVLQSDAGETPLDVRSTPNCLRTDTTFSNKLSWNLFYPACSATWWAVISRLSYRGSFTDAFQVFTSLAFCPDGNQNEFHFSR